MGYIRSVKHCICYENGMAEQSFVGSEDGIRIRIYDENNKIIFSENYDFKFNSAPLQIFLDKMIKEYKLSKIKEDYISIHTMNNNHNFYFMVKKANKISTEITYRMDEGNIYRSMVIPVKYEDIDTIMNMCAGIY